ncbi:MAG: hypothetical protein WCV90_03400 [Candidatus Woesearchaeota archaeon]|jgi:phosphate uptake regulator
MERKLVKQGRNALTVTLPAKWLQYKSLKQGDSVFLEEREQKIIISSLNATTKSETAVDVCNADRGKSFHLILGKYLQGYDRIGVLHNNPSLIQEIARELLGMAIEEHSSNKTVIKNIIVVPEDNFKVLLRRSAHILVQQTRTMEQVSLGKAELKQVKEEERLLDYNLLYCLRYLNKYEIHPHAYRYFLICSTLELTGDQISRIAQHIGKNKELAKKIVKGVEQYVDLLFKNDFSDIYTSLRQFRQNIGKNTFVEGLAYNLAENLYNNIGYLIDA